MQRTTTSGLGAAVTRALCAAAAIVAAASPAAAAPATTISHYGGWFAQGDGWEAAGLMATVRTPVFPATSRLALDLSAPLEFYRRRGEDRFQAAADYAVLFGVVLPPMLVSGFCPTCRPAAKAAVLALSPLLLPVVHPVLVATPVRGVSAVAGYDAMYRLHRHDEGILFSPFLGLRFEAERRWRLEGGIDRQLLWNWRRADRSFGGGWFVRVGLSTDWVGGAEASPSYD